MSELSPEEGDILRDLLEKLEFFVEQNKVLTHRLEETEKNRDEAINQSIEFSNVLKKAVTEITAINELNGLLKQKSDLSDSVIDELRQKLAAEKASNQSNQSNGSQESFKNLLSQLDAKTKALEASEAVNAKMRKDHSDTKKDVEGMLSVLHGLEQQLNQYAAREEEIEEFTNESRSKLREAVEMTQKSVEREEQYKREISQLRAENKSLAEQNRTLTNSLSSPSFPSAGGVGLENSVSLDESSTSHLEDSQVSANLIINYCGDAVDLPTATALLGFDTYSNEDVVDYVVNLADRHGLISQSVYQRGLAKLLAYTYISIGTLQRSISDYIIDNFFSNLDGNSSGYVNAHEVACGLLLFCEGDVLSRASTAWTLLSSLSEEEGGKADDNDNDDEEGSEDGGRTIELYLVIQALAALYKVHSCLNPQIAMESPNYRNTADNLAIKEIFRYWAVYNRKSLDEVDLNTSQVMGRTDFLRLFVITLMRLQRVPVGDTAEEEEGVIDGSDEDEGEDEADFDSDSGDEEQEEEEQEDTAGAPVSGSSSGGRQQQQQHETFSSDGESETSTNQYLKDELFPPSSVVLELRAARSILGFDGMAADDLLESLGSCCHAGVLSEAAWKLWLWKVIQRSSTSEADTYMARNLGLKLFSLMDPLNKGEVLFSDLASGLAFLCGDSPVEDRLMVAFTIVDGDCDGYISGSEFETIVYSVLVVMVACSKLVNKKIVSLGVDLRMLARSTAMEGLAALSLDLTDEEISFEMVSELSEDYIKLAAIL